MLFIIFYKSILFGISLFIKCYLLKPLPYEFVIKTILLNVLYGYIIRLSFIRDRRVNVWKLFLLEYIVLLVKGGFESIVCESFCIFIFYFSLSL